MQLAIKANDEKRNFVNSDRTLQSAYLTHVMDLSRE